MSGAPGAGIECPSCGSTINQTKDTRPQNGKVKRKRKCYNCSNTFATVEIAEGQKVSFQIDERAKVRLRKLIENCRSSAEELEAYIEELNK